MGGADSNLEGVRTPPSKGRTRRKGRREGGHLGGSHNNGGERGEFLTKTEKKEGTKRTRFTGLRPLRVQKIVGGGAIIGQGQSCLRSRVARIRGGVDKKEGLGKWMTSSQGKVGNRPKEGENQKTTS